MIRVGKKIRVQVFKQHYIIRGPIIYFIADRFLIYFSTPLNLYTIKAHVERTLSRSQWRSATKEVNDLANSLFPNM